MAVKIRLCRFGSKKRPSYRILVMDSRKAPRSRPIEQIGYYNPFEEIEKSSINMDRLNYWMKCGAIPTERVALIVKKIKEKQVARINSEAPKEKGGSEI